MRLNLRSSSDKPAGRGCATLFGGFFALMGLVFVVLLAYQFFDRLRPYFWRQVPCTILESQVVTMLEGKSSGKHEVQVRYRFEIEGHRHESSRVRLAGAIFDKPSEAKRLQRGYRSGEQATCYVNGDRPPQSVLVRDSLWFGLVILMPLIFVAVGVGIVVAAWRHKPPSETPLSERHGQHNPIRTLWFLRIFGLIFFLAGAAFGYGFALRPWLQVRAAADWVETPCTILSSEIASHSDGDGGPTYSLEVRYEYVFAGEKRTGDRYNFVFGSSSSRDWRARARNAYPKGRQTVYFVDPGDPDESVLVRELGPDKWFGLLPLVFVAAGLGIMLGAPKVARKNAVASPTGLPATETEPATSLSAPGGMVALISSEKRVATFIGFLITALFWNGIVWAIFLVAEPPLGVKIFLGIFIAVGVAIAVGAVGAFLAIFNPQPELVASGRRVSLGGTLDLQYRFRGNVRSLKRLKIRLLGQEVATSQRGSNTKTDKHTFLEVSLVDTTDQAAMAQGAAQVRIPADTMHSFDATNNKIVWAIHLQGEIGMWPKVKAEFPLVVLPLPTPHS